MILRPGPPPRPPASSDPHGAYRWPAPSVRHGTSAPRNRVGFYALCFLAGLLAGYVLGTRWYAPEPEPRRTSEAVVARLRAGRLPMVVERTAYSLEVAQTDSTPFIARCGRIAPAGVPIGGGRYLPAAAVSRDLLKLADCGARIRVDGREYVVWDTMAARWTRRVDLLAASRGEALRLGRRPALLEIGR